MPLVSGRIEPTLVNPMSHCNIQGTNTISRGRDAPLVKLYIESKTQPGRLSGTRLPRGVVLLVLPILVGSALAVLPLPAVAASITCGTTITTSTVLTSNIGPCSGNGITIGANNVVLNCAGHIISGNGVPFYNGVFTAGITGAVIMNCHITGFYFDVNICCNTQKTVAMLNTLENPTDYGAFVDFDNGVSLVGNLAHGGSGITLLDTTNSVLVGNIVTAGVGTGFSLTSDSSGNLFAANVARGNAGFGLSDPSTGTGTSGTANTYHLNLCPNDGSGASSPPGLCIP